MPTIDRNSNQRHSMSALGLKATVELLPSEKPTGNELRRNRSLYVRRRVLRGAIADGQTSSRQGFTALWRITSDSDIPAHYASDEFSVLFPYHQIRPHGWWLGRVC